MANGPWQARVQFTPGGGMAFRPGELLVRSGMTESAEAILTESFPDDAIDYSELLGDTWSRFVGLTDPLKALGELRGAGIFAQPNHVLFAMGCCPPHPSTGAADDLEANPFMASSLMANPFMASSVLANPFMASPFMASPFMASAAGGCCCCGGGGAVAANPFMASANPNPAAAPWFQATGRRRSTARPAPGPVAQEREPADRVRIAILDTGIAAVDPPDGLEGMDIHIDPNADGDAPDEDGDNYLDPVAGHGTFVAGVIEQLTPGCRFEVFEVLTTYGDGDEAEIAQVLWDLSQLAEEQRPHIVNLSFGSYSPIGMEVLADAVAALHEVGVVVVASAGNDATCVPTYPAALPNVVSVGALDEDERPASYTNYGSWVRACSRGTDVVSSFFQGFNGAEPPDAAGADPDNFDGWAQWSGTSFAAPRVVAALARRVHDGLSPQQAVVDLIDNGQPDIPMLGTVVLP